MILQSFNIEQSVIQDYLYIALHHITKMQAESNVLHLMTSGSRLSKFDAISYFFSGRIKPVTLNTYRKYIYQQPLQIVIFQVIQVLRSFIRRHSSANEVRCMRIVQI